MSEWIMCEDKLPPAETAVLVVLNGVDTPCIGIQQWEICNPFEEQYFKDFLYWDDAIHDGQGWDDSQVLCWMPLPAMPTLKESSDE